MTFAIFLLPCVYEDAPANFCQRFAKIQKSQNPVCAGTVHPQPPVLGQDEWPTVAERWQAGFSYAPAHRPPQVAGEVHPRMISKVGSSHLKSSATADPCPGPRRRSAQRHRLAVHPTCGNGSVGSCRNLWPGPATSQPHFSRAALEASRCRNT